jgi:dihydroflavonol-4-reductase
MTRVPLILVTGISGFVAKHCALELLRNGYRVRGTLRDLVRAAAVNKALSAHVDTSQLEFVAAELLDDTGWDDAMEGVSGVLHLASPFPLEAPAHEDDVVRPAVEGTLRVLRAAADADVARFVHTSSIAAIVTGHERHAAGVLSERDWCRLDAPKVSAYARAKTMAELAARAFVSEPGLGLHYTSVAPGFVLGPPLDADMRSASVRAMARFFKGRYPGLPRVKLPVVDVRDVARAHRLALEGHHAGGARFALVSDVVSMRDLLLPVKAKLGAAARRVPTRELPDAAVKLIGLVDPATGGLPYAWSRMPRIDDSATRAHLGLHYIAPEQAAVEMAESLVRFGLV